MDFLEYLQYILILFCIMHLSNLNCYRGIPFFKKLLKLRNSTSGFVPSRHILVDNISEMEKIKLVTMKMSLVIQVW
jgi:hypothetical protein